MNDPHPELQRLRAAHRRIRRPSPELRTRVARVLAADRRREQVQRWLGGSLVGCAAGLAALLVMHWISVSMATHSPSRGVHEAAAHQHPHANAPATTRAPSRREAPQGRQAQPAADSPPPSAIPPSGAATSSARRPRPAPTAPAVTTAPAASPPGPAAAAPSELDSEVRLLRQAEVALANEPVRARALLAEHERRFPHTALALERRALEILATCAATPSEQARRGRDAFLREHPGSAYAPRVRAACR